MFHMQEMFTLCDPLDCNLPGSSARETFQARILEWIAIPFSRGPERLKQTRGKQRAQGGAPRGGARRDSAPAGRLQGQPRLVPRFRMPGGECACASLPRSSRNRCPEKSVPIKVNGVKTG